MTPEELADALAPLHRESWGWALSCCGHDDAAAEDVLQTAYVRVLAGKARFDGRSSLRTWLFGVVRRVAQEERRRRTTRRRKHLELAAEPRSVGTEPLDVLARSERSEHLLRALDTLSERQREVLHLVFYQDMSIAEAAEVMGVSLGSARTHYDRGKKGLRALLEGEMARERP